MLYSFLYLLAITLALLPWLTKWYQKLRFGDALRIPTPPTIILFGNIFDMGFNVIDTFTRLVQMRKKYGQFFGLWMTSFNYRIVLSDPEYTEKILTSNVHLGKGSVYSTFEPLLGNGLVNSEIKEWKKNRKILSQSFHVQLLKEFAKTFNNVSNVFIENMKERSFKCEIDLYQLATSYTLDSICETMMGVSINAQRDENKEFTDAVSDHLELIIMKFFSISRRIDLYYRYTRHYAKEKSSLKIIKEFVRSIVLNRENIRNRETNENGDDVYNEKKKIALLDLLLDLKADGIYNEQDVIDHTITFLLGGNQTIGSSLSFLLYEIAKHPDIQRRILEEVHAVVGENNNEEITFEHAQKLQFTECVIKECLRMYPPITFFERTLQNDITLGDYRISKNTSILFFPYGAHRDEKLFPNPEQFDPDRFSSERINEIHPFSYLPFSHGPRNCIGMPFALCQLKVVLANILRKLEIKPASFEHKPIIYSDCVLKSANGLPVNIKIR